MQKHTTGSIEYYLHGDTPRLLLLSGMHGDEAESAVILQDWVTDHLDHLPPFLYVPFVSASSVRLGTRENGQGHDINRQFKDGTDDTEVLDFLRVVDGYTFDLGLDLHEDRDRKNSFYLYDSGQQSDSELEAYRALMAKADIPLYTGIDDPDDDTLDCMINQGYYSLYATDKDLSTDDGFSNIWLIKHHIVRRKFTLENPQQAAATEKLHMIDTVIPYLIERYVIK